MMGHDAAVATRSPPNSPIGARPRPRVGVAVGRRSDRPESRREPARCDRPAGRPGFVDDCSGLDAGDAAFPVDQRLPASATRSLAAMRVGEPVEPGDALVVATSGSTGEPEGCGAHPRRGRRVGAGDERAAGRDERRSLARVPAAVARRRALGGDASPPHRHDADRAPRLRRRRRRGRAVRPSSRWSRRHCHASTPRGSGRSCSAGAVRPTIAPPTA